MNICRAGFYLFFIILAFQLIAFTHARKVKKIKKEVLEAARQQELAKQKELQQRRKAEIAAQIAAEKAAKVALDQRNEVSLADYSAFIDDKNSFYDRKAELRGYADDTNDYNKGLLIHLKLDTPEKIQAPLNTEDYYLVPVNADSTSLLKKAWEELSPLTWHNNMQTVDSGLKRVSSCDKGLWLKIAQNLTETAKSIDAKYSGADSIQISPWAFRTFPIEQDMLRLFVILHELKIFIKKMHQFCVGIQQALEGPSFFLRESSFLFLKNLERRFIGALEPIFPYDPFSREQAHRFHRYFLFREVLFQMYDYYAGKEFQEQLAIFKNEANLFNQERDGDFRTYMMERIQPLGTVIGEMLCMEKKANELIEKYSSNFPTEAETFEEELDSWVAQMALIMSEDGRIETEERRYNIFEIMSKEDENSALFEIEEPECAKEPTVDEAQKPKRRPPPRARRKQ